MDPRPPLWHSFAPPPQPKVISSCTGAYAAKYVSQSVVPVVPEVSYVPGLVPEDAFLVRHYRSGGSEVVKMTSELAKVEIDKFYRRGYAREDSKVACILKLGSTLYIKEKE